MSLQLVGTSSCVELDGSFFRAQHAAHIPCMQRFTGGVIFTAFKGMLLEVTNSYLSFLLLKCIYIETCCLTSR